MNYVDGETISIEQFIILISQLPAVVECETILNGKQVDIILFIINHFDVTDHNLIRELGQACYSI